MKLPVQFRVVVATLPIFLSGCNKPDSRATHQGTEVSATEDVDSQALSNFKTLLGKGSESPEMVEYRKQLEHPPSVTKFDDCFYQSWTELGLSFRFKNDLLAAIFLYAEGADGFKQYGGELPERLRFSDTRRDIEKKLGNPQESGGEGVIPFWAGYPSKGVEFHYTSKDIQSLGNTIHHITISSTFDASNSTGNNKKDLSEIRPNPIDSTALRAPDSGNVPVAISQQALDRFTKLSVIKDSDGVGQMMLAGSVWAVPTGTKCKVINAGFLTSEVRILDGAHSGKACFVASDFIAKK